MNCQIITSRNFHEVDGLAVVIDVLRAFSSVCFALYNGAYAIIPVAEITDAYLLKKKNPSYILIGERNGVKPEGFDHNNSPAEIENVNFQNKMVILATSSGTKGLIESIDKTDEIITASFVNIQAVINYIGSQTSHKNISLICTDYRYQDNEDYQCALYIKHILENKHVNFHTIKNKLKNHPSTHGFLKNPLTKYSKRDFNLCMDIDRFNFVVKAQKEKEVIYLKKIQI